VVAHGHGPSTDFIIKNQVRLKEEHGMKIFTLWRPEGERVPDSEFQYDHAAKNETSIMMSLHPLLVHMEELPQDPDEEPLGLIGKDPRTHASREHGDMIMELHLDRMKSILRKELNNTFEMSLF